MVRGKATCVACLVGPSLVAVRTSRYTRSMSTRIRIEIGKLSLDAELSDASAAEEVARKLPLQVRMSRWGSEYYGDAGIAIKEDATARQLMEVGEIAYWPPGSALCIFFGPTPASTDERPRAASPVLPVGRILSDTGSLAGLGRSVRARFMKA